MDTQFELKTLRNLADSTWRDGICFKAGSGQAMAIGISEWDFADLILTLWEDGYLHSESNGIRDPGSRANTLGMMRTSSIYHRMQVTYRGLRRIDELRDQLRRDRILEKFGILLDGRYLMSDIISALDSSKGEPVSLLFADVDDFKLFNTMHGSKAGDEVLRHVFRVVRDKVADRGEVYRRGGEEIVAVLPYLTLEAAELLAECIRVSSDNSDVTYGNNKLHATMSIGVAASPPCDPDGPSLETFAENAMKQAKYMGKNRVIAWGDKDNQLEDV